MLKAKLVVVGGDAKTTEVKLRLPTIIGRGKEGVTLTLPHQLVSRQHTEIYEKEGYLFVRDLGSLNGTYLNNKRISEPQVMKPGELLTLGNVTFRAVYDVPEGAAEPVSEVQFTEVETEAPNESAKETAAKEVAVKEPAAKEGDAKDKKVSPAGAKVAAASAGVASSVDQSADDQLATSEEVLDEPESSDSPSATDRSLVGVDADAPSVEVDQSSVFSIEDEGVVGPEKSISMSALNVLPEGQSQVSFVGKLDFEGVEPAASEVEAVELDLGDDAKPADASESGLSGLGSFLKKLPK